MICEYGCGQEAKYQLKNRRWCCSENHKQCPSKRREQSIRSKEEWEDSNSGFNSVSRGKKISNKIRKAWEDLDSGFNSTSWKEKQSEAQKGRIPWNKGKTEVYSKKTLKRKSEGRKRKGKLTIEKIKKKYPFFSKIEEMRYNPNKPSEKEIQVHCKNHLCENSKEKGGWFIPSLNQIQNRKNMLVNEGIDRSNFYCSEECKNICPLYKSRGADPFKNTKFPYTQAEKDIFNKEVLERQRKEDGYNFCEKCESTENLHVHHEKPVKTHPHLALDPDNGIVLCRECHYKYGHKTGTECSTGNLTANIC